ncbi:hypothetical protein GQ607_017143 [Colletotrichum asianum]|uniref:Uncharacterized protein n=1 Tax=Colletotrichum asianum TaxID=702518 RepID=A0A8H3VSE2_9PEZI|nr:hypothetical protein GQ607_017143 [Colletotrichum asianum]
MAHTVQTRHIKKRTSVLGKPAVPC